MKEPPFNNVSALQLGRETWIFGSHYRQTKKSFERYLSSKSYC